MRYVNTKILDDANIIRYDDYNDITLHRILLYLATIEETEVYLSRYNYASLICSLPTQKHSFMKSFRTEDNYPAIDVGGFHIICLPKEISDKYEILM